MKKALFVLLITTIALTGFRKSDALVVTFNNDNSKAIDLSKKKTSTASWSVTADTTKKGGGRRADETPYKGTGNGGKEKEGKGGNGKKETSGPGTGGVGKTSGGRRGDEIPYKGTGNGGKEKEGKGGNGKKETEGNGGNGKTEAVIFRQQKK